MAEGTTTSTSTADNKQATKSEEQNLTVALRVRPINEDEIIYGATPIIHKVDKQMVVLQDPSEDPDDILRANRTRERHFMFDITFDGSSTQREVYEKTCQVLIPNVINGYNATVFAYGATGAGKTYTMLGRDEDPGIMGLAVNDLFQEMAHTREDMAYKVTMSYLEIYNEMIRDLLNPASGVLDLREDAKGVQVAGLSEFTAKSTNEVMDILMQGNKERTQEPTAANKTSSRSHAVLQISVRQRHRVRSSVQQQVRLGKLFLIDLAGSERAANTQNTGKRMVEGAHINRSLLALGNCINALSERTSVTKYINYRDSKLTRILKDALGGNCKTVMIAHISPSSVHFEESRNTLVYADRAKHIKTKVRRNVLDVSYHIQQYTNIIGELREEIQRLRQKLDSQALTTNNAAALHAIKNEVINSSKREQAHLLDLKHQLMAIFKEQMELRRSVMELNNTGMEISLETTRNQLLVKRWQREKDLSVRRREYQQDGDEQKFKEEEKRRELAGSDEAPEPTEVRLAREDLQTLEKEREATEKLKRRRQKELEQAKVKAAHIEQLLPQRVSSQDQQEILSLLCKVHELEIENMGMQSSCLLRNFELRKQEMIIAKYEQHRSLCDEIIQQQRELMDENNVFSPKELEDLYELYQQEEGEMYVNRQGILPDIHKTPSVSNLSRKMFEGESVTDFDRLSIVDEETSRHHLPKLFTPSMSRKQLLKKSSNTLARQERMFSRSPQEPSRHSLHAKTSKSSSSLSPTPPIPVGQTGVVSVLSSRSDSSTPPPPAVIPPRPVALKVGDRQKIMKSTRNIAALAARRRYRAQADLDTTLVSESKPSLNEGTLNRTYTSMQISGGEKQTDRGESDSGLTESRLAQHNKHYTSTTNLRRDTAPELDQSTSSLTSDQFPSDPQPGHRQGRALYRNTTKKPALQRQGAALTPIGSVSRSDQRTRTEATGAYQQLSRNTHRKNQRPTETRHRGARRTTPRSRHIKRSHAHVPRTTRGEGFDRLGTSEHPSQTVYQSAPERGKGLTVLRKVKGPAGINSSTDSTSSQPQHHQSRARHHESQPRHHESQPRHHQLQTRHHESQARHHQSQARHHDSQARHHQSQQEPTRSKAKKAAAIPTVPNYRKGDIAVTGVSIQR